MAQSGQRKCLCCGLFFDPDARNRERQRYCSAADCAGASKAASQATWLARPENSGYFRDPCTSLAYRPGAPRIRVMAAASVARRVRYKIP